MKKFPAILLAILLLNSFVPLDAAQKNAAPKVSYEKGIVVTVDRSEGDAYSQKIRFEVLTGKFRGKIAAVVHMPSGMAGSIMKLEPGNRVIVYVEENPSKAESPDGRPIFQIADYQRDMPMLWLAVLFAVLIGLIGGMKGIKSIIGLLATGLLIFLVQVPLTLRGWNPILLACVISGIVSLFVFRIVGGRNKKSLSGALGTIFGVTAAGLIAWYAGSFMNLSGMSSEESKMLMFSVKNSIDYRGILFSGIIIGALGAVMDVGMSIASAIEEVRKARPDSTFGQLFMSGMNVGRDVMGTMSNTLILAYVGSSLPLILLFIAADMPVTKIMNMEMIAEEVLRALSGSIGLILCIPITALITASLFTGGPESIKNIDK